MNDSHLVVQEIRDEHRRIVAGVRNDGLRVAKKLIADGLTNLIGFFDADCEDWRRD